MTPHRDNLEQLATPLDAARWYVENGLSVLPIKIGGSKSPAIPAWKDFQDCKPSDHELTAWFKTCKDGTVAGVGIVCGSVSGNLAVLDFESEDAWKSWLVHLAEEDKAAYATCPVVRTPSGGRHVYCRVDEGSPKGGRLAFGADGKTLKSEIRGEGNYVVAPGSPDACHKLKVPYALEAPGWLDDSTLNGLPLEMFTRWCDYARAENEYAPPEREAGQGNAPGPSGVASDDSPGSDFNRRGTWEETGLFDAGWKWDRQRGDDYGSITRPGKETGVSATIGMVHSLKNDWPLFYCFSSSVPGFEPECPYSRFAVYAKLKHADDYPAAAGALRAAGYGGSGTETDIDISGIISGLRKGNTSPEPTDLTYPNVESWEHDELLDADIPNVNYIVESLVADASLTILGGVQKAGKSWLAIQMVQSVATGTPLLGCHVVQGRAVYLALEDGARRLQKRLKIQQSPRGLPITWKTSFPKIDTQEGMNALAQVMESKPRLVVIDTLSAAKGGRTKEDDSAKMAELFNNLRILSQHHGVAIVLVHHHGKSTGGDPAHDLRGSSAIGAAADMLLGLYRVRRKSDGSVVERGDAFDPDNQSKPEFYLKVRGRDCEDSQIKIHFDAGGSWTWNVVPDETSDPTPTTAAPNPKVVSALTKLGRSDCKQIASEMGVSKGTARRWLEQSHTAGHIKMERMMDAKPPRHEFWI